MKNFLFKTIVAAGIGLMVSLIMILMYGSVLFVAYGELMVPMMDHIFQKPMPEIPWSYFVVMWGMIHMVKSIFSKLPSLDNQPSLEENIARLLSKIIMAGIMIIAAYILNWIFI